MEWQPIETAPMDETAILSHESFRGVRLVLGYWAKDYEEHEGYWAEYNPNGRGIPLMFGVTHWMPLPPDPV